MFIHINVNTITLHESKKIDFIKISLVRNLQVNINYSSRKLHIKHKICPSRNLHTMYKIHPVRNLHQKLQMRRNLQLSVF